MGQRLARAARHLIYGETVSASGPVPRSVKRSGDRVEVQFEGVDGALVTYSAMRAIGFELCGADQNSCRFVDSQVQRDGVSLDASASPGATRVRFCWADAPVCNLYDRSGLPAGPFESAIEK